MEDWAQGVRVMMQVLLWMSAGYMLGSVPFGYLLTRMAGAGDIRQVGSGNIGATNVLRTGRRGLAAATLVLDGLKGLVIVVLAQRLAGPVEPLVAGAAAVFGHCTTIWMGGRGGKGVATGLGTMLAWSWPVGVICAVVWLAVAFATRLSSAAALVACAVAPLAMWALAGPGAALAALFVSVLVALRHHANIARLIAGTEPRIGRTG